MADPISPYGKELKARRMALRLSQQALAERAGTERTHVNKIERGRIWEPTEPVRSALLRVLAEEEDRQGLTSHAVHAVHEEPMRYDEDPTLDLVMLGARRLTPASRRALVGIIEDLTALQAQIEEDLRRDGA